MQGIGPALAGLFLGPLANFQLPLDEMSPAEAGPSFGRKCSVGRSAGDIAESPHPLVAGMPLAVQNVLITTLFSATVASPIGAGSTAKFWEDANPAFGGVVLLGTPGGYGPLP